MTLNAATTSRSIADLVEQTVNSTAEKLDLKAEPLGGGAGYRYVDFHDKNLGLLMRVHISAHSDQSGGFSIAVTCYPGHDLIAQEGSFKSFRVPLSGPGQSELDHIAAFVGSWARNCMLERLEKFDHLRDELDSSGRD